MWLAVFLWRPLAGREGRTVLCADVNQALAGLEASQRLAARDGGQGPTQAHHGGRVVLFWRHAKEGSIQVCYLLIYYLTVCVYSACKMSPVHQAPPFCFPSVLESESRLISTDRSSVLGKLLLQVNTS